MRVKPFDGIQITERHRMLRANERHNSKVTVNGIASHPKSANGPRCVTLIPSKILLAENVGIIRWPTVTGCSDPHSLPSTVCS